MALSPNSSMLVKDLIMGFCLGAANIIPGVSGGTFLLIFGIYERVFAILSRINRANTVNALRLAVRVIFDGNRPQGILQVTKFLKENDFIFLIKLIIGAAAAIIGLSSLMKYLIVHHFSPTYSLFFGLILVSIIIPVQMLKQKKAYLIFFALLGAALTIYVSWAVNPYEKVRKKSLLYQEQYMVQPMEEVSGSSGADAGFFTGRYTSDEYLYAALCGAVAVSAMVLPGISGSLVLILMGAYFQVVSAISGLTALRPDHFIFLGCFSVGVVFGGLFFARLVSLVLSRYYDATMAFLIGLMAGSLYALWPFKQSVVMARRFFREDGQIRMAENVRVYTNINQLPEMGGELYLALACCVIGGVVMSFFVKKEQTF